MMQPAGAERVLEGTHHMALTCHVGEGLWTPLAGQREIGS